MENQFYKQHLERLAQIVKDVRANSVTPDIELFTECVARFGHAVEQLPASGSHRKVFEDFQASLSPFAGKLPHPSGTDAVELILNSVVLPVLNTENVVPANPGEATISAGSNAAPKTNAKISRPVFIVSAPRAGNALLLETLSRAPGIFTTGPDKPQLIEQIQRLHPSHRAYDSNRLTAMDAELESVNALKGLYLSAMRDRDNKPVPADAETARLVDGSPKNALRIPFLSAAFPDALFIYLYRDPAETLGSIMEAWLSRKFVTYPRLPNWLEFPWSMLLTPDWRQLRGKSLAEIAAAQWILSNQYIMDDLAQLPDERWDVVTYRDLVAQPQEQIERLCKFAGIDWDQTLTPPLPPSKFSLTPPDPQKWRKHGAAIDALLPRTEPIMLRARDVFGSLGTIGVPQAAPQGQPMTAAPMRPPQPRPQQGQQQGQPAHPGQRPQRGPLTAEELRSVHTQNFPDLLKQLGITVLVSTYQAGKVVALRLIDGKLNTHFRNFHSPMGMACDGRRLAIGTAMNVLEFRNQPHVGRQMQPPLDACYLPRSSHVTGDIRIHEIGYGNDELWIVNTRFSCLCTLDKESSFVPRWRPPFITKLAAEDRCHLNGMAMIDNKPKYVTMLGQTDTVGGWRQNKASGGCMMDVDSNEIVLTGLSMPHSPRKYNDKYWILESGYGRISLIDLKAGKTEPVAELPGFTRGIDFFGPFAFIGLSQVRETAVFSGVPITERLQERICGIWVVDLRNGKVVAFLKFEGAVQEIFAVQVLAGVRFPDIITDEEQLISNSFTLPDEAMKDVAGAKPG